MKKNRRGLLFMFLFAACSAKEPPPRPAAETPPPEETFWNDPAGTRIGLLLPLSGPAANYGRAVLRGVACAAGLYTPCPPPHRPIQLRVKDTRGDAAQAAAAAQTLVEVERVSGLIGPLLSGEVPTVAPIAEAGKIPLVVLAPHAGEAIRSEVVFQHSVSAREEADQLTQQVSNLHHFFLFFPQNQYGEEYRSLFREALEREGKKIVGEASYPADLPDFTETLRPLLNRLPRSEKTGLFIPDSFRRVVKIAEALNALDAKNLQLIGTSRWHHPQLLAHASASLEGALLATPFLQSAGDSFYDNCLAAFGGEPAWLEAVGFDAAALFIRAVETQESDDPAAVREGLAGVQNFEGAVGSLSWDKEGASRWPLHFLTIRGGEFVPLQAPDTNE